MYIYTYIYIHVFSTFSCGVREFKSELRDSKIMRRGNSLKHNLTWSWNMPNLRMNSDVFYGCQIAILSGSPMTWKIHCGGS